MKQSTGKHLYANLPNLKTGTREGKGDCPRGGVVIKKERDVVRGEEREVGK